jgi:hypothetical protein
MAGRLNLAVTGIQDQWLTGEPEFSYFLMNFKRHTKFSIEAIETPFDGDIDYDATVECRIPKNKGDLVRSMMLKFTLPQPTVPDKSFEVTESGLNYYIDGVQQDTLTLYEGSTYTFNVNASSHPFYFSETSDGVHSGITQLTNSNLQGVFETSVSIYGDNAIIGSSKVQGVGGSFRIYSRVSGTDTWNLNMGTDTQVESEGGTRIILLSGDFDAFGYSVDINDKYAVVGAPQYFKSTIDGNGYIRIVTNTNGTWSVGPEIEAQNGVFGDKFGYSVAISGDYILVGAPAKSSSTGSVYIFKLNNGTWSEHSEITGSASDLFGSSVSIDGNYAIIGAPGNNKVYIYHLLSGTWTLNTSFTKPSGEGFGTSVSINGTNILVGAPNKSTDTGSVYPYILSNGTWSQGSEITATGGSSGDFFGISVDISNENAVIGAYGDDLTEDLGTSYVFVLNESNIWTQKHSFKGGTDAFGFGYDIAISGNYIFTVTNTDTLAGDTGDTGGLTILSTSSPINKYFISKIPVRYTNGVTGGGTSIVTFTVPSGAPSTLYYYCDNHSNMGGQISLKKIIYRKSIGAQIIEYADLLIGGQTIERITGDYIYMYDQIHNNKDDIDQTLYFLTGHDNYYYNVSYDWDYNVLLPFYFFRHSSLAIPVCALTKQLVEVRIKFKKLNDVTVTYTKDTNTISDPPSDVSSSIKKVSLVTDFFFVTEDEKNFLLTRPIEYVITQLQMSQFKFKAGESKKAGMLNFKNPVREMFFLAVSDDVHKLNPIKHVTMKFNNTTIIDADNLMLSYEQPLKYYTGVTENNFGVYSFSMKPETHYPTGQVNMSRIAHNLTEIELDSPDANYGHKVYVYAVNYNVLRINSGLGGLKF